jgi:hypothetical protein
MSIFALIRQACAEVARRARFVQIRTDRLAGYAQSLPLATARAPVWDKDLYLGPPETLVAFILTLNTINFGSGYFPHLRKRPGRSGFYTVALALTDYFYREGPLPARTLASLTAADCARLFDQPRTDPVVTELMDRFAHALNDLGQLLVTRYDGRFSALIEAADRSAERLVSLLAEMPYFRDVARYDELEVPFYKRAQITAADLAIAFGGQGYGAFTDLSQLTIFADNLVPHVLRVDGILTYAPELLARINAEALIPAGSPEEVEIRACALHAVEQIVAVLRAQGEPVTALGLDYLLWNRGQQPRYKAEPRHRTRSVYY